MRTAVNALSALAHQGRLSAFRMLIKAGKPGMPAGEIARQMATPPNTLSASLTILANAGLIESRREGRSVIYTATYKNMAALLEYLMEDCCGGSPEICSALAEVVLRSHCEAEVQA